VFENEEINKCGKSTLNTENKSLTRVYIDIKEDTRYQDTVTSEYDK